MAVFSCVDLTIEDFAGLLSEEDDEAHGQDSSGQGACLTSAAFPSTSAGPPRALSRKKDFTIVEPLVLAREPQPFNFNSPLEAPEHFTIVEPLAPAQEPQSFNFNSPLEPPVSAAVKVIRCSEQSAKSTQLRVGGRPTDWIFSSTIRIRDHVSAMDFAHDMCRPGVSTGASKRFVVWTDGSAGKSGDPMAAAVAYQALASEPGALPWIARGFGILGYQGGSEIAELIGIAVGLEVSLDVWDNFNLSRGQKNVPRYNCPPITWINKMNAVASTDLTANKPQTVIIDLTADDSSDDSTEDNVVDPTGDGLSDHRRPGSKTSAVRDPDSSRVFQELHLLTDSQSVLLSCKRGLSYRMALHGAPIAARVESLLKMLAERHVVVHFHWVPGHSGIEGNERADRACGDVRKNLNVGQNMPPSGNRVWEVEGLRNVPMVFNMSRSKSRMLTKLAGKRLRAEKKAMKRAAKRAAKQAALELRQRHDPSQGLDAAQRLELARRYESAQALDSAQTQGSANEVLKEVSLQRRQIKLVRRSARIAARSRPSSQHIITNVDNFVIEISDSD